MLPHSLPGRGQRKESRDGWTVIVIILIMLYLLAKEKSSNGPRGQ